MILIFLFVLDSIGCYLIGLSMADRLADHKIKKMRLEAGLDIYDEEGDRK